MGRRRGPVVAALAVAAALAVVAAACTGGSGHGASSPTTTGGGASSTTSTVPAGPPVPDAHRALYDTLSSDLDAYAAAVRAMPTYAAAGASPPVPAVELLAANGNRLQQLLAPATMPLVVETLDAFRRVGVRGVTLGVKLPMLLPELTPDAARYADFFAGVAEAARARGMTVDVELGALFCGTVYATCAYTWPSSVDAFADLTARQARVVIDRLHPDLLTVLAEPTTEAALTGITALGTPDGAAEYVRRTLAGIGDRGTTTKVGAGGSSWTAQTFDDRIATAGVDYLDTHVYPVGTGVGARLAATAALAHRLGLPLVVDEAWLYKATSFAGGPAQLETVFRLDSFSFFAPLDARFLTTTRDWARKAGATYASAFWSWQLFAYVDWTPALDTAPYQQLSSALSVAALSALRAGRTTADVAAWTGS